MSRMKQRRASKYVEKERRNRAEAARVRHCSEDGALLPRILAAVARLRGAPLRPLRQEFQRGRLFLCDSAKLM